MSTSSVTLGTSRGLRLHIGLFGRTNVGKSSLMNILTQQPLVITAPEPGTTTDPVEKAMELLPFGPITLIDTAGLEDHSSLGAARQEKTRQLLAQVDVAVLVTTGDCWGETEESIAKTVCSSQRPLMVVFNQTDRIAVDAAVLAQAKSHTSAILTLNCVDSSLLEQILDSFKTHLKTLCPPQTLMSQPLLLGDLLPAGGLVVMVVPIDLQAPKGRLILPQVQAIRDVLDHDAAVLVVKDREYSAFLSRLTTLPDLVVCDSQVVARVVGDTPENVPLTTFSILFARMKGDLAMFAEGARQIDQLQSGDNVLIAEACTHHALEDDIAQVKIPRWLRQYTGCALEIEHCMGKHFPDDLSRYRLVIHCGGCTITPRMMQARMAYCLDRQTAITNYGVAISKLQGVLDRVLQPFYGDNLAN